MIRFEFEHWLEQNYRKLDENGRDLGPFTAAEIGRSMHRGYPADKFLLDMMREIHRYFEFPKSNRMAVGLGGGHSGFTVCALHVLTVNDPAQHVYVDTPAPESDLAKASGFFRQSWGAQIIEMMRFARNGDETRLHFAKTEGAIPSSDMLERMGIKVFFGVGHETTGATTYSRADILNLLDWIDRNPAEHHAGARCDLDAGCDAMGAGDRGAGDGQVLPVHAVSKGHRRHLGLFPCVVHAAGAGPGGRKPEGAVMGHSASAETRAPVDPKMPLSGKRSVDLGPIYDPLANKMVGGVINTFSTLAFAETTFGLLRVEKKIGPVAEMNRRSEANRAAINEWMSNSSLLELGVGDPNTAARL